MDIDNKKLFKQTNKFIYTYVLLQNWMYNLWWNFCKDNEIYMIVKWYLNKSQ